MTTEERYLELLKKQLIRWDLAEHPQFCPQKGKKAILLRFVAKVLGASNIEICKIYHLTSEDVTNGKQFKAVQGETMIGIKRMDNIAFCVKEILKNNVAGDLIETGVWRGGAVIYMKALLECARDTTRKVWVADSFEGLPVLNQDLPHEATFNIDPNRFLAVSEDTVKANFEKYGLLDDNVQFLKGWFKDTLPVAPIQKLAVLRLDGDYYESTMDALTHLYPKLSVGGYVIIDDFALSFCKKAVLDFRSKHTITEKIEMIDWTGVYWKKAKEINPIR